MLGWLLAFAWAAKPDPGLCGICAIGEDPEAPQTQARLACLDTRLGQDSPWKSTSEDGRVVGVEIDVREPDRALRSLLKSLHIVAGRGGNQMTHNGTLDRHDWHGSMLVWSDGTRVVDTRYYGGELSSVAFMEKAYWASQLHSDHEWMQSKLGRSPQATVCPEICNCLEAPPAGRPGSAPRAGSSIFDRTRLSDLLALTAAPRPPLTTLDRSTAHTQLNATVTANEVRSPEGWTLIQRQTDDPGLVDFVLAFPPGSKASPLPVDPSLERGELKSRYAATAITEDSHFDLFLPDEDGAPWARWTFRNGDLAGLELRATKPLTGRGPDWSPYVGCIEHDGGECKSGKGTYQFADGTRYEGTWFQDGSLVGEMSQHPETPAWYPAVADPGEAFRLEAYDDILADAACGGCASAERLAASDLTTNDGTVRTPEDLLTHAGSIEPWEVNLLVFAAGWKKEDDRILPPTGGTALVRNAKGQIAGLEVEVGRHDALPFGLTQGSRSELIERYGAPWVPLPGKLHLVTRSAQVMLLFSKNESRVVRVRWTLGAADAQWGTSCEDGPITSDGPNLCTTSDGYSLQGEFRNGALLAGSVRDLDGVVVAEIERPPTPEERAALDDPAALARATSVFRSTALSDMLALTARPRDHLTPHDLEVAQTQLNATVDGDRLHFPEGWTVWNWRGRHLDKAQFVLEFAPGSTASPLPVDPSLTVDDLVERYAQNLTDSIYSFRMLLHDRDGAPRAEWHFDEGRLVKLQVRATKPLLRGGPKDWSPTGLGCIEHDGGECDHGSGVYQFAEGNLYEGTFYRGRPLTGTIRDPDTEPGSGVPWKASPKTLADAECGGCGDSGLLAASALTTDDGTLRGLEELLTLSGSIRPWEIDLLSSQEGWKKERGNSRTSPDGSVQLWLDEDGRIAEGTAPVGDDLPFGFAQGSRSELFERYGAPYEPLDGRFHLVKGDARVELMFAEDGSRVERVRATRSAVGVEWGASCEDGPITNAGRNTCTTSDGFVMTGDFEGGRFLRGTVTDRSGKVVDEVTLPPTARERAAIEAARIEEEARKAEELDALEAARVAVAAPVAKPAPVRVMDDGGFRAYVAPPPGWSCEVDRGCSGPPGLGVRFSVRHAPRGIEALVQSHWAATRRGCVEPDPLEGHQMTLFCDEGDSETDARGWASRSYALYREIPGEKDQVVVVRFSSADWENATPRHINNLLAAVVIGGVRGLRGEQVGDAEFRRAPRPERPAAKPIQNNVLVRAHVWHTLGCATMDVSVPEGGQGSIWEDAIATEASRAGYRVAQVEVVGLLDKMTFAQKDKRCGDF